MGQRQFALFDPLSRLAIKHGSDKLGSHVYTPHYNAVLQHLRDSPIRLLEIGIGGYDMKHAGGSSLRMWADYFPYARIVGLDFHPKSFELPSRVRIEQGSQDDPAVLDRLMREHGPFDVVIDDGSHQPQHITTSFLNLYPGLTDNGIYIVEDTQLAFRPEVGGNNDARDTIFELGHRVALAMHILEGHQAGNETISQFGRITASITTLRNAMIFTRGPNTYPSNLAFDMTSIQVSEIYERISDEASANPGSRATLSRIDMNIWGGRIAEAERLALRDAEAHPNDRELLTELERLMVWAGCGSTAEIMRELRENISAAEAAPPARRRPR